MNIFRLIEETKMGIFLASAIHSGGKVSSISIHPIVDEIIYPALLIDELSMSPLIEKIEEKLKN
jgi:hypothetical protein